MYELPEEKSMWQEKLRAEQPDLIPDEEFSPALTLDEYYKICPDKKPTEKPLISIKLS